MDYRLRKVFSEKVAFKLRLEVCEVNFGFPVVWKFVRIRGNVCGYPTQYLAQKVAGDSDPACP